METILEAARKNADLLLKKKPLSYPELKSIPPTQGVYLIYDKEGNIIYVGKGKVLRRRIKDDHISGETRFSTSIFRKKISRVHGIPPGEEMRKWIIANCSFAWLEIPDKYETGLVEVLLITYLKSQKTGATLLND